MPGLAYPAGNKGDKCCANASLVRLRSESRPLWAHGRLRRALECEALGKPLRSDDVQERRSKWEFLTDENRLWFWRAIHPDHTAESKGKFRSITDCITDARANGYVLWAGDKERRRRIH
jgi:hypothetical protein